MRTWTYDNSKYKAEAPDWGTTAGCACHQHLRHRDRQFHATGGMVTIGQYHSLDTDFDKLTIQQKVTLAEENAFWKYEHLRALREATTAEIARLERQAGGTKGS